MKKISYIGILLVLITMSLSAQDTLQKQEPVVVDQIVAIVGRNIIRLSDVENSYINVRLKAGTENAFESKCEILENFLMNKLLIHQAEIDSVVVDDEAIEREIDYRINEWVKQYGSKENLEREAKRKVDDIKDQLRESLKERNLAEQTQRKITSHVKVTPNEVAEFFKKITKDSTETIPAEYEIMQIMKVPEVSEDERTRVRDELNQLRERIVKGEKFATLAALYSQDPGSAKKGGELGLFTRGDMVGEFEATAFQLKPGEVSPVIETKYGFHILQLIERRGDFINVRHILLTPKVSPYDLQQAKFFLDSVSLLIQNKTYTFEEAALLFSDDGNKNSGGIIINPTTGSSHFTERVANEYLKYKVGTLEVGKITQPLPTVDDMNKDAFRILSLKTKSPEHKANLTDDYNKIYDAALNAAQNEELLSWCKRRKDKSYIKIFPPYDKCNFKVEWVKTTGK